MLAIATGIATLALAVPAQATFHLISISEVATDENTGNGREAFIELQMYASGQNHTATRELRIYRANGTIVAGTPALPDVPNGENQRTILIGDSDIPNPDVPYPGLGDNFDPLAGAVCFVAGADPSDDEYIDCVAWGTPSMSFPAPIPALVGTHAAPGGIPDGQSLARSITPNCPTLLEAADDTNDSATDFSLTTTPTPRPNSVPPTETSCGGALGDTTPPETTITKGPKGTIEKDTAKFRFTSDEVGSTFECKAPGKRFKKCSSPKKLKNLDEGKQKFKVRAIDKAGNVDPTPAKRKFKVDAE
jgi:hypothetical protein